MERAVSHRGTRPCRQARSKAPSPLRFAGALQTLRAIVCYPARLAPALNLMLLLCGFRAAAGAEPVPLRPPAVPLVACDPYFSIWSPADRLTDTDTVHWTGTPHRLSSLARIDGKLFRLVGKEPASAPPLPQTALEVLPTSTRYQFEGAGVHAELRFTTPALPADLDLYSRPITYVSWSLRSKDAASHRIELLFGASAEIAVNSATQAVICVTESDTNWVACKIGSRDQAILAKRGDDLRIDWGHFYLAAPKAETMEHGFGQALAYWRDGALRAADIQSGNRGSRPADIIAYCRFDLAAVGPEPVSRWVVLAYDDEYSIQYHRKNLRPYWRRNGQDAAGLLREAVAHYSDIIGRCDAFDAELMADLTRAGGRSYAELCALAYRQCCAGNKVVADANGQPLMFPKENSSSGMIGTVDVLYPMSPQFLLLSPSLTRAMLVPAMDYAGSHRWLWPFAPHDLGRYPVANGQTYGTQMPVEETANLLLLNAALARAEGGADFAAHYWPLLERWAGYLQTNGFDPEEQLCTDDFTGPLAHNANLAAKAICAVGAFAQLCDLRGQSAPAEQWRRIAQVAARRWMEMADDEDHYRLAFDQPGTWSQKYNLVWDRVLGLNLFPDSVRLKETAFAREKLNPYGLPLDIRETYTEPGWSLWTASFTRDRANFEALVQPIWRFFNETPDRAPMTDWYWTKEPRQRGFRARPVVGGLFLQMLYDEAAWKKWAGRDKARPSNWAPVLQPPVVATLEPTSEIEPRTWRFATNPPAANWFARDYDASSWREAPAGFGTNGMPGALARTPWTTPDLWLRREFTLASLPGNEPRLRLQRSSAVQVYLNGVLAASLPGASTNFEIMRIKSKARETLRPGRNLIALHAQPSTWGQFVDVGLVDWAEE
jgi:hypothetical protein